MTITNVSHFTGPSAAESRGSRVGESTRGRRPQHSASALTPLVRDTSPSPIDARQFRDALSHYASGITIVSSMVGDEPVGFTCQSFYSVSVDPPLVSFSVMTNSTTYPRIRESGRFAVNVLAHSQHEVSNQFARKGTDKWAGIAWHRSDFGNPIIEETTMWLECELSAQYTAGDHFIVVGRVVGLSPTDWQTDQPLVFFKGAYRRLSDLDTTLS